MECKKFSQHSKPISSVKQERCQIYYDNRVSKYLKNSHIYFSTSLYGLEYSSHMHKVCSLDCEGLCTAYLLIFKMSPTHLCFCRDVSAKLLLLKHIDLHKTTLAFLVETLTTQSATSDENIHFVLSHIQMFTFQIASTPNMKKVNLGKNFGGGGILPHFQLPGSIAWRRQYCTCLAYKCLK